MGGVLAEILAKVAIAVLQWYAARKDIRDAERGRMLLAASELAQRALRWKANHPVAPGSDPAGDFRVRDDGGPVSLSGDDSSSPEPPAAPDRR